jgi:hypothetical protein
MSDREIAVFFKKPSTGSVCGRFLSHQLDRNLEIPRKRIPWLKYFFQIMLPAFFISKAGAQQVKMSKAIVNPRDTSKVRITDEYRTMGIVAPCIKPFEKDTTTIPDAITKMLKGKVIDQYGNPVPFAYIRAGKTMNILIADEKGEFSIQLSSIAGDKILSASARGFEAKEVVIGKDDYITIQLTGNTEDTGAMISSPQLFKMGEVTIKDPGQQPNDSMYATDKVIQRDISIPDDQNKFYVYSNPAASGTSLTVGVHLMEEGHYDYQLLTIDGKLVDQKEIRIEKDARLMNIETPARGGSYLFVLINRKSGKKFTEKIIIQ